MGQVPFWSISFIIMRLIWLKTVSWKKGSVRICMQYMVTSVSLKFEPHMKYNCEYLRIKLLYQNLVYLILKVLAWEIYNMKLEFAKKSHNTVTITVYI